MSRHLEEIDRLHERVMQVDPKSTARLPNGGSYKVYPLNSAAGCESDWQMARGKPMPQKAR